MHSGKLLTLKNKNCTVAKKGPSFKIMKKEDLTEKAKEKKDVICYALICNNCPNFVIPAPAYNKFYPNL